MLKFLLLPCCTLVAISAISRVKAIDVKLTNDATEGITTRVDLQPASLVKTPVILHLALKGSGATTHADVIFTAEDIFEQPLDWKDKESVDLGADGYALKNVPFPPPGPGYFLIHAQVQAGNETAAAWTDFGVVAPPFPGKRPDSFFASNTSYFRSGAELDLLEVIGMKVERVEFYPKMVKDPPTVPSGEPVPMDFTAQDKVWANTKARGIWVLPMIGYSIPGDNLPLGEDLGMYGPPQDNARFAATWASIMRHYPEISTVEMWNEPWIFGWTFAGTPAEYCDMQKAVCEAMLKVNPNLRILAGSSTSFVTDNIEPTPSCWRGILSGISQHPYTVNISEANARPGDQMRAIDETPLFSRRMKLPYAYLTEGGVWYSKEQQKIDALTAEAAAMTAEEKASSHGKDLQSQLTFFHKDQEEFNNIENAERVVQYFVQTAIDGLFQGDAQWQIGYGPGWTRSTTTFAVMTHFLEDRPVVADIWPANELIWGGVFANPKFVTDEVKRLPRAEELSSRWSVPIPRDRADDRTKVAVFWSLTGQSNSQLDSKGTIAIDATPDLKAYDMVGRDIPSTNGKLVLPFTAAPVYVTSDALDVVDLRKKIAGGEIHNVTPVNFYCLSLLDDPAQAQNLSVRMENQLNVPVQGTLKLKMKGTGKETLAPFLIGASNLKEIQVLWPGAAPSPNNQYGVTLSAEVSPAPSSTASQTPPASIPVVVTRDQLLAGARFVKRTIPINGSLDAWKGIAPVLLDSDLFSSGVDLSQYMLNPGLEKPTGNAVHKRSVARIYTAYDQNNVYIAAAVNEDSYHCDAGQPVVKGGKHTMITLPYKNGMPGGLNHIVFAGNVFEFAFGFRDRVPGWGRQMDDPYAWKGSIFDTDYNYVAHASTDGDQLIRLWSPQTQRRNGYQTEAVPGQEPVPDGKVKIVRDEDKKLTIYEMAIPRSELELFDPAAGRCRFGFVLFNGEGVTSGNGRGLNWSDAAGVFDYWRNEGSFAPTWSQHTACQTFFGIK